VWHLFIQICQGIAHLHRCGVVHRALKTRNLLLFPESFFSHSQFKYRCKIVDIGLPELQRHSRLSALNGSMLRYLAPEVLRREAQDDKVDVWALGCVLHEMATLSHAFNSTSAIQRADHVPFADDLAPEFAQILRRVFQVDPRQRPTAAELLQLPSVRSRAAAMPFAEALDVPPQLLPDAIAEALVADGAGLIAAGMGAVFVPGPETWLPAGVPCWAQRASDGLWYQAVVYSQVDADCYLVQLRDNDRIELVWFDGLRVVYPHEAGREMGGALPVLHLDANSTDISAHGCALKAAIDLKKETEQWDSEPSSNEAISRTPARRDLSSVREVEDSCMVMPSSSCINRTPLGAGPEASAATMDPSFRQSGADFLKDDGLPATPRQTTKSRTCIVL